MKLNLITLSFAALTALPQVVKADTTDITQCLRDIKSYWITNSSTTYLGKTRSESPCQLSLELSSNRFVVKAEGTPINVSFELGQSQGDVSRTLEACRVDKEKIHLVFEEKNSNEFEKRERVQMTLLKRLGKGLSLILFKRENKLLRPLQQNSLICHLDLK